MRVYVIYAHPNPNSFNRAILESFTKGLKDAGHTPEVSDLYKEKFYPCMTESELPTGLRETPGDVKLQQERVTQADALVFIYPVWWLSMPAILKGWIDRVLKDGFAYELIEGGGIRGLLRNRTVLLINTTGASEAAYREGGLLQGIQKTIDEGIFGDCGIQDVRHVYFFDVLTSEEARRQYLDSAYRLGREF